MVFTTVGLPVDYITILLTVDWFLNRRLDGTVQAESEFRRVWPGLVRSNSCSTEDCCENEHHCERCDSVA